MEFRIEHADRKLAEMLAIGIANEISRILRYHKYCKVFIENKTKEQIAYANDKDNDVDLTETYDDCLHLRAFAINDDTLHCAAQVHIQGYRSVHLMKDADEDSASTYCYVFYKNVNDIDFADDDFANYKFVWGDDEKFQDRFQNRNSEIKIKRYNFLKEARDRQKRYLEDAEKDLAEVKATLTEEELLFVELNNSNDE